jgi:HK97 gp10 family phage protein
VRRDAIEIRIEGLEASRAALEQIIRQTSGAIDGSLATIGEQWVTEIVKRAPVKTGTLRRSYTYTTGRGWVEVGSNVHYAAYQEFGTSRQRGTPHVRPGTDAMVRKIPGLIAAGVDRSRGGGSLGGAARIGRQIARLAGL